MRTLGVIPARGGSKGLEGKNIKPLGGKPLMGYVIEAALAAKSLDLVVVSTEDDDIARVSESFGVRVIRRPPEFATDHSPIEHALRHVVRTLEAEGREFDLVIWMQANVPTTKTAIIDQSVETLKSSDCDSVQTVVPFPTPPQWSWRLEGDRLFPLEGCYQYNIRRQDEVPTYYLDGSVCALRRRILMETEGKPGGQVYFGVNRRAVVLEPGTSVEIDNSFDFELAEFLLSKGRL